jgi:hypothetical protein
MDTLLTESMVVASLLLTSEFLQEPRGNFRQDGAQLISLGYHDASRSRFLRFAFGMTRRVVVNCFIPCFSNLLPHHVVTPDGALCREESAVLDPVPVASKADSWASPSE